MAVTAIIRGWEQCPRAADRIHWKELLCWHLGDANLKTNRIKWVLAFMYVASTTKAGSSCRGWGIQLVLLETSVMSSLSRLELLNEEQRYRNLRPETLPQGGCCPHPPGTQAEGRAHSPCSQYDQLFPEYLEAQYLWGRWEQASDSWSRSSLFWPELCPQSSYVEAQIPSTSECNYI